MSEPTVNSLGVGFLPAAGREGTVFGCALCGATFTHGGLVCGSCPLGAGCDLVRCPHCGYQFPRASRLVEWFERAAAIRRSRAALWRRRTMGVSGGSRARCLPSREVPP